MGRVGSSSSHTIHYMNGVIATPDDAKSIKREIRHITGQPVKCHHNPTTSTIRIIGEIGFIIAGIVALAYAMKSKGRRQEKVVIGGIGITAIVLAIIDYNRLQHEKNQLAAKTARKIKKDLRKSADHRVTIVLHSQGADIGSRMFKDFTPKELKRIRVITLGGMVSIPNSCAAKVINFRFKNDYVSKVAQSIFDKMSSGGGEITHIVDRKKHNIAHDAEFYIAHRDVRRALRENWII